MLIKSISRIRERISGTGPFIATAAFLAATSVCRAQAPCNAFSVTTSVQNVDLSQTTQAGFYEFPITVTYTGSPLQDPTMVLTMPPGLEAVDMIQNDPDVVGVTLDPLVLELGVHANGHWTLSPGTLHFTVIAGGCVDIIGNSVPTFPITYSVPEVPCSGATDGIVFGGPKLLVNAWEPITASTIGQLVYRKVVLNNSNGAALHDYDHVVFEDDRTDFSPGLLRVTRLLADPADAIDPLAGLDAVAVDLNSDANIEAIELLSQSNQDFFSQLPGWNAFTAGDPGGTSHLLTFYEEIEVLGCPFAVPGSDPVAVAQIGIGWNNAPYAQASGLVAYCAKDFRFPTMYRTSKALLVSEWQGPLVANECFVQTGGERFRAVITNTGGTDATNVQYHLLTDGPGPNRFVFPIVVSWDPGNGTPQVLIQIDDIAELNALEQPVAGVCVPRAIGNFIVDPWPYETSNRDASFTTTFSCVGDAQDDMFSSATFMLCQVTQDPDRWRLGPGEKIIIEYGMRICHPWPGYGQTSTGAWLYLYYLDYCDHEMNNLPYGAAMMPMQGIAEKSFYYEYGPEANVATPSFQPGPEPGWALGFRLQGTVNVWRGDPAAEYLLLEADLQPGMYISEEDHDRFYVHLPQLNTTLTVANDGLEIFDCQPVDCSDGSDQGWTEDQRLFIKLNLPLVRNVHGALDGLWDMLANIYVRTHCQDDTGQYYATAEPVGPYTFPCTIASTAAPPSQAYVSLTLYQVTKGGACTTAPCDIVGEDGSYISLAAGGKLFTLQCPGCARWGIHAEKYIMKRITYGTLDPENDGSQSGAAIDPEAVWTANLTPGAQPLDQVRSGLAMVGDVLEGRMYTHVENDCTPPTDYGPCYDDGFGGLIGPEWHSFYYETKFNLPVGALEPLSIEMIASRDVNGDGPPLENVFTYTIPLVEGATYGTVPAPPGDPWMIRLDLSPDYIEDLVADQHIVVPGFDAATYASLFAHGTHLEMRTRFRVVLNNGNAEFKPVDVINHMYFGEQPFGGAGEWPTYGNNPALTGTDAENYLIEEADCGEDLCCMEPPCTGNCQSCSRLQYFCTNQAGFVRLAGYSDGWQALWYNGGPGCALGLTYRYGFNVGPDRVSWPVADDAFPHELRNWGIFSQLEIPSIPTDWDGKEVGVYVYTSNNHNGERIYPEGTFPGLLSMSGLYPTPAFGQPSLGDPYTPDDDYRVEIYPVVAPECDAQNGPYTFPLIASNTYADQLERPMEADSMGFAIAYDQPQLAITAAPVQDIWGQDTWVDVEIEVDDGLSGVLSVPGLWFGFDYESSYEDPDDGRNLKVLEIRNAQDQAIASNGGNEIPPGVFQLYGAGTATLTSSTSYHVKLRLGYPCDFYLPQGPGGLAVDHLNVYAGWSCEAPTTLPDPIPDPADGSCFTAGDVAVRPMKYLPEFAIGSAEIEDVCVGIPIELRVANLGEVPMMDVQVTFDPLMFGQVGPWTYVPGSLQLTYQVAPDLGGEPVTNTLTAGVDMPDIVPPLVWELNSIAPADPVLASILADGLMGSNDPDRPTDQSEFNILRIAFRLWPTCPLTDATRDLELEIGTNEGSCGSGPAIAILPDIPVAAFLDEPMDAGLHMEPVQDLLTCGTQETSVVKISVLAGDVPIDFPSEMSVLLPPELEYVPGSASNCLGPIGDPVITPSSMPPGSVLTFEVDEVAANTECAWNFDVHPSAQCSPGTVTVMADLANAADCPSGVICTGGSSLLTSGEVTIGGACNASATLETSGSACSGPYQVDCAILPVGAEQPLYQGTSTAFPAFSGDIGYGGHDFTFGNGQGVLIQHLQGTTSITGKLHESGSPNEWWIQLYLNNAQDWDQWDGNGYTNAPSPYGDQEEWIYYELDPNLPSLLSLYGNNEVHDIAAISLTAPDRWFQMGMGANTYNSGDGLFGKFLIDVNGTWKQVDMHLARNCDYDFEFSVCSGKITVVPGLGLVEPYEVSISTVSPVIEVEHEVNVYGSFTMFEACSGPHTVTVTDANGCVWTGDVTVPGSAPLEGDIVYTHDACEDGGSAMAINVTGGTPDIDGNYSVSWHPINQTTTQDVLQTGLSTSDENWVRVEDASGCYFTYKFFINEIPNTLILVATGTDPDCGQSNGMVETEVAGAEGQLTYTWDPPSGNVPAITGVGPGIYTVTVTDEAGCSRTETVELEAEEGTLTLSGTSPSCHGGNNGTATILDIHGTPTILWSNSQTTVTATGLVAGTYTVTVTDAGCVSTGSITITDPAAFTASIGYTNPSCPGAPCNGSASANLSGAQGAVTYAWASNGSPAGGNSANVANLCGGPLTLTATDANGCVATANATIPLVTCGPVINNCGNLNNLSRSSGSVSVAAISGALYYQFNFNTPCGYNRNIQTAAGVTTQTLNFSTLPLEDCQTYSVKARAFMTATQAYGPWGPECTMTTNGCAAPMQLKPAYVWSPNLVALAGNVEVNKRNDAYRYQFEFWSVDVSNNPVAVVKTVAPTAQGQTGYVHQCNKASVAGAPQLSACTKYKVRVRRSLDCTTNWEGTWGPYVLIKTNGTCPPGMALEPGGGIADAASRMGLSLFPNPNDGTELNVVLTGIEIYPAEVRIEMLDILGRVVQSRILNAEDEILSTVLPLDPALGAGLYTVRTMSGETMLTSTFVLER